MKNRTSNNNETSNLQQGAVSGSYPNFDVAIEFRTLYGWLKGVRKEISFSYGAKTSFFISDKIKENKHWATFTEKEIYEWRYL